MAETPTSDDMKTKDQAPPSPVTEDTNFLRTVIGGFLMGVANIIPGVSGGTMLLATGIYERFVESVADLTKFKGFKKALLGEGSAASLLNPIALFSALVRLLKLPHVLFIAIVGFSAVISILVANKPINLGLTHVHHLMYALFIGLTLGGVPLLWKEIKINAVSIAAIVAGILIMAGIALISGVALPRNFVVFFIAGILASMAMVLPGISGSYLLLIFGLYYPISKAIEDLKEALKATSFADVFAIGFSIILPVGLGVLVGIAALTNILKALLHRFHNATMGVLLGLLLGSVLGLYPFKALKDVEKDEATGKAVPVEVAPAKPATPANIALVLLMIGVGFAGTYAVSRIGNKEGEQSAVA